jgi:hypothetical protein
MDFQIEKDNIETNKKFPNKTFSAYSSSKQHHFLKLSFFKYYLHSTYFTNIKHHLGCPLSLCPMGRGWKVRPQRGQLAS